LRTFPITEALYRVHVVTHPANVADARELLFAELERVNYPIREIETLSEGEEQVELAALLVPTTANPAELDAIVAALESKDGIESAASTVSTTS
jgi:putative Mg2+ transporter-C (MgtC) family protein